MATSNTEQSDLCADHSSLNKIMNATHLDAASDARQSNYHSKHQAPTEAMRAITLDASPSSQPSVVADQSTPMSPSQSADSVVRAPDQLAAHAVLFTNELLCDIVIRLPLQDIVAATGVCRQWNQAMAADQGIQRALFLKAEPISEVLARKKFVDDLENPIPLAKCKIIGTLHPFLHRICGRAWAWGELKPAGAFSLQPFDHPEGTWRNMYATQPPARRVVLPMRTRDRRGFDDSLVRGRYEDNEGVKMGQIYDIIESRRRGEHYLERFKVARDGICIQNYATDHGARSMVPDRRRNIRCSVINGEVQRPAILPGGNAHAAPSARLPGKPGGSFYWSTSATDSDLDEDGSEEGKGFTWDHQILAGVRVQRFA